MPRIPFLRQAGRWHRRLVPCVYLLRCSDRLDLRGLDVRPNDAPGATPSRKGLQAHGCKTPSRADIPRGARVERIGDRPRTPDQALESAEKAGSRRRKSGAPKAALISRRAHMPTTINGCCPPHLRARLSPRFSSPYSPAHLRRSRRPPLRTPCYRARDDGHWPCG